MPSIKKHVPRFGSLQLSGPRNECDSDPEQQTDTGIQSTRRTKGVRQVEAKTRPGLKVKLPKLRSRTLVGEVSCDSTTPVRWILEPTPSKTRISGDLGGDKQRNAPVDLRKQDADADSAPADESVYFSTQGSKVNPTSQKEKAKLSVLRTVSRMLEENRLIRQRLDVLSQAN